MFWVAAAHWPLAHAPDVADRMFWVAAAHWPLAHAPDVAGRMFRGAARSASSRPFLPAGSVRSGSSRPYYKKLMLEYPGAKVLLSIREPEKWHQSCLETLYAIRHSFPVNLMAPLNGVVLRMNTRLIWLLMR